MSIVVKRSPISATAERLFDSVYKLFYKPIAKVMEMAKFQLPPVAPKLFNGFR